MICSAPDVETNQAEEIVEKIDLPVNGIPDKVSRIEFKFLCCNYFWFNSKHFFYFILDENWRLFELFDYCFAKARWYIGTVNED